ncbi:MAG: NAD(P)H-dependent oxidoreductase, partial [Mailhella sp.]|nr:NAD(P)H-dependent oxidoreductase [Mailhella sp.]
PVPSLAARVADAGVRPCASCGRCLSHPGECALDGSGDGAAALFAHAAAARLTLIVSPIYFYHLPAQAKAWIDRAQRWWALPASAKPAAGRTLSAILIAARERGEHLFDGAERSLRYMALALGMEWHPALRLYGYDSPGALRADSAAQERIRRFAAEAWHVLEDREDGHAPGRAETAGMVR